MWQNRIVGEGLEDPEQLLANPHNWRIHPKFQQDVLKGVLAEVGWVQQCIVNVTTQHIVDGHLRVMLALERGESVPVVYVELTEDEEKKVLAALDSSATLATTDAEAFIALAADVQTTDPALNQMLALILDGLSIWQKPDPAPKLEAIAALRAKWNTDTGQVWQIPSLSVPNHTHLYAIGDSSEQDWRTLAGEPIELVCTDPPYDLDAPRTLAIIERLADRAVVLSSGKQPFTLTSLGWHFHFSMVWRRRVQRQKPSKKVPLGKHGLIILISKRGDLDWTRPENNFESVIELPPDEPEYEAKFFGQAKNHKLLVEMLRGFAYRVVGEPFAGTGSTLLACEVLRKRCVACERDADVAAIALERIADFGLTPVLMDAS